MDDGSLYILEFQTGEIKFKALPEIIPDSQQSNRKKSRKGKRLRKNSEPSNDYIEQV